MNRLFKLAVLALAGSCMAAHGQVLISEVVSGPHTPGNNPKYIQLFNASGTTEVTLGGTTVIRLYSNGAATSTLLYDFGANSGANEVTILPGEVWTYASGANSGASGWIEVYGVGSAPSLFTPTTGPFFGNGNDVYTLEDASGIVDIYGRIGQATGSADFSMDWAYNFGYARRGPTVCAPSATFDPAQWVIGGNNSLKGGQTANAGWDPVIRALTTPGSHSSVCALGNDCNGNGVPDATDIARGTSQDCNHNSVPDECDIASGGARDCNNNGIPDSCEVNASNDCNGNGILDVCEIAGRDCNNNGVLDACDITRGTSMDVNANQIPDECEPFLFDCNGNMIEDATDIMNGTSQDCNHNNVPDECETASGELTDADGNGTFDACEGAFVGECYQNATVQPAPFGVRDGPNGLAFFNIEGVDNGTFASYGGLRFDMTAAKAQFDGQFGAGMWTVDRAYLFLVQSNAAFTRNGGVEVFYSANDTQDFADNANPEVTFYGNFDTDFADRQAVTAYTFTQGANGTKEAYSLYDADGTNTAGGESIAAKVQAGASSLTVLMHEVSSDVAATYAGYTNFTYRGPSLVIFARMAGGGCPPCAADFNQDGGVDGGDVESFFTAWEGGEACGDVNQDGGVDGGDVEAFYTVWEAGGC